MYRAKRLFEKEEFEVIPYKIDYKVAGNSTVTIMDLLPSAANLELTETGALKLLEEYFIYFILNIESKQLKILSNSSSVKLDPLGKHNPFSNNLSATPLK